MVYQEKITTNGYSIKADPIANGRPVNLGGDISDVAHDVTRLMELQGQLLLVDVSEVQQKLKLPLAMIAGGAICLLCSLPLLLVAAAQGLMVAGLPSWAAYLVVGIVGIAGGALSAWKGSSAIKTAGMVLDRSKVEFTKNLNWFKQILRQRSAKHCESAK